jgi:cobalt-zinc-cadmium efflux system membrane fusion protein
MTTPLNMTPQNTPTSDHSAPRSQKTRLWLMIKVGFAALVIGTVLVLLWSPFREPTAAVPKTEPPQNAAVVQLVSPRLIAVQAGSLLEKKLAVVPASREQLAAPVLTVTGSVVARLRSGNEPAEDRLQFSSPELLTTYADWQKGRTEVDFAEKQLGKTRELTAAQLTAQTKVVERLRKLVAAGTEATKDLATEEANLLQTQLEGQKTVFEAETAVKVAVRNRAALERQLFQAGVDPHLLERANEGATIVMADVPEAKVGLVAAGQACEARFYGFPETVFPGKVSSLSPTLSGERRTLRVLFELHDRQGRLKPGMYAEIGLGTDPRQTVLLPADSVLHIGRSDYVLVEIESGVWQVTEVKVGEQDGTRVEILEGLQGEERVIGSGAILLKPVVVRAVQS